MHTTKDIAVRLDINPQTVRRWARQYADYMSDGSQHADALQFSDDDLLVLWSVRRWRQLGYSLGDIADRLGQGERVSEPPPEAPASDAPPRAVMVPEGVHTAALAEVRRLEADRERLIIERDRAVEQRESDRQTLSDQIRGLEREIGELRGKLAVLETDRQPASWWLNRAVVAVLAAVVLTVIIAGVVLWLSGPG